MKHNFDIIDELYAKLNSLKPFTLEDAKRLEKKFRLEFNYNSNHLEGNTLTYGETELLLIFDDTVGNHNMREYEEIKAHDVAYHFIEDIANDNERPLSEQIIKNLNEIILVRPYWKDAITPDGQSTRKQIKIGNYKEYPNSVRLQNGEIFEYASPADTPILMQELVNWYRDNLGKLNPITLAIMLHYKFVCIHPFDDGNGRISRLLMNYVLLNHGFPPVIIRSDDKNNYLRVLHIADVGDLEPLIEYISKEIIWSLRIALKAGKGEELEDNDDFIKEIELIRRRITKGIPKSPPIVYETFELIDSKLWKSILKTLDFFSQLFNETKIRNTLNNQEIIFENNKFTKKTSQTEEKTETANNSKDIKIWGKDIHDLEINQIGWYYILVRLFGTNPLVSIEPLVYLELQFGDFKYYLKLKLNSLNIYETEKAYNELLLDNEIEDINRILKQNLLDFIKQNIN